MEVKMTQRRLLILFLTVLLTCGTLFAGATSALAVENVPMEPYFGQPFQPDGVTFGQVSFLVPVN